MPTPTQPPAKQGANWPSSKTKPSPASIRSVTPPATANRPTNRSNKTPLQRITKPISRFKKSPASNRPIILAHPKPQAVIRSILSKPSSLLNLSTSPTVIDGSQIALVIGTAPVQSLPSSVRSGQAPMITKRVRFSGELVLERSASSPPESGAHSSCEHDCCPGQTDVNGAPLCGRPEPVIETIFLTYSRAAYDRSPIAVDRVFNKSLALPPRMQEEEEHFVISDTHCWLADLIPPPSSEHLEKIHSSFNNQLADSLEQTKMMLPSHDFNNHHQMFLTPHQPEDSLWQAGPDRPFCQWTSEDGLSESTGSSSSLDPATPCTSEIIHSLLPPIPISSSHHQESLGPSSLSVENLAHHALENLSLNLAPIISCQQQPLHLEPLCAFGNWSKSQVFDSCDALDGF
ncbi:hypothetical protein PCANC_26518 [Puccinia coronata f. sp. avenae]|uniref:Uncharacterized protein n=1 Tax=Puccinia coronata f. sp. avenae TaxID=200324 RepID=A0A2N5RYE5_9BASI|nr:hypothetical protein PCANC_26518 [Puccinia coronata f. sp. avenae]PLW16416.1 hypothetical protein PCASD_21369 [Puccinia coronata f. sp. avenae]PLW40526.1 hypothetical protein PCASD_08826 [Puccinia coronata f. sp. avenae]